MRDVLSFLSNTNTKSEKYDIRSVRQASVMEKTKNEFGDLPITMNETIIS